ncbi:MAG: hypothetical protein DRJ51_00430 [Thermoprotei archaeon]|nr:MAG: hypothetical protein DRJ51_00430 [Thermoprotei archaeon]
MSIIYWQEAKITLKGLIKTAFKRIFTIMVSPFTTFDDINARPETMGPALLMVFASLLQLLLRYSISQKLHLSFYQGDVITPLTQVKNGNITVVYVNSTAIMRTHVPYSEILEAQGAYIASTLLMLPLAFWLLMYAITWIVAKILKGNTENLVPASGYILVIPFASNLVQAIILSFFLQDVNKVILALPLSASQHLGYLETLIVSSLILALRAKAGFMEITLKCFEVFLHLWTIVLLVALYNGAVQLSIKKSIVLAIVSGVLFYLLYSFIVNFMVLTFLAIPLALSF